MVTPSFQESVCRGAFPICYGILCHYGVCFRGKIVENWQKTVFVYLFVQKAENFSSQNVVTLCTKGNF